MANESKRGNLTIFIFPYLFLDKEWEIIGYKLKPSYSHIVTKESTKLRGHLDKIARSFRLRNTNLVNQYTYGWTTIHNEDEWKKLKGALDRTALVLRYEELSDERNGANFSNFDYAVFEIYRPMSKYKFAFYEGVLNGKTTLPIHYPQTKFCPNSDIRPYILMVDKRSQVLNHFLYLPKIHLSVEEDKRLLRALDWFNKSHKSDPEIDDVERFMNLAIAFEALFDSPEEGVQAAIKTGVISLLGETQEMIHWVKDFYEQRSKIVHGKEEPTTLYRGRASNIPHLWHIGFARKVFVRCVKAILTSREAVYTKDLHKELVSNERRIKEILQGLRPRRTLKQLYESKIFDTIDSLNQKDVTGTSQDVIQIGQVLLPKIRSHLRTKRRNDLVKKLDDIVSYGGNDLGELGVMYGELHSDFSPVYFDNSAIGIKELPLLVLKGAIYHFTGYAGWKLLTFR